MPGRNGRFGGSSPRGRGTLVDPDSKPLRPRFIPARAGNAPSAARIADSVAVHPRAGGERTATRPSSRARTGSSPRGRGTLPQPQREVRYRRFIPARAGNASSTTTGSPISTVHPRAGGERMFWQIFPSPKIGSSPRGRGTLFRVGRVELPQRFIPARAGNAPFASPIPTIQTVHPRAGGERTISIDHGSAPAGSSPRGRGTR